ncbi:MAG: hypothetical protein ACFFBD_08405 [Candidatus Hodarchaeota archaeon]
MVTENEENFAFGLHETVINFSTNNAELMEEVRGDFGSFEKHKDLKFNGQMKIIQIDKELPLVVPKYAIRDLFFPEDVSLFTISNQRFREEKGNRIYRMDYKKNTILGYFRSSYDFFYVRYLLKWLLIKSLEKQGIAFIHGSGVERNGTSLFFVGPSGFGKTHTLITFLLEGYKLITDDTIFCNGEKVLPFSLRSRISSDMFEKFPVLKKGIGKIRSILPEGGVLINLGDLFPIQKKEIRPSKLFFMYVWNAPETKIELIPKKEMLARLLHIYKIEFGSSMWFNYEEDKAMKRIFPRYQGFVEKADCYKVYVGRDLTAFRKTIHSCITETDSSTTF